MKIRIFENGIFAGAYNDEFISDNWNNELNGSLVSEWIIIDSELPNESFVRPKWDGEKWIEGASAEEIAVINQAKINEISAFYRNEINVLVLPYIADYVLDSIPLPFSVEEKRALLKEECNLKIQEIDPAQTMSRPTISKIK